MGNSCSSLNNSKGHLPFLKNKAAGVHNLSSGTVVYLGFTPQQLSPSLEFLSSLEPEPPCTYVSGYKHCVGICCIYLHSQSDGVLM